MSKDKTHNVVRKVIKSCAFAAAVVAVKIVEHKIKSEFEESIREIVKYYGEEGKNKFEEIKFEEME